MSRLSKWILDNLYVLLFGLAVTPLVYFGWDYLFPPTPPDNIIIRVNANGFAMPFTGLLDAARIERPDFNYETDPAELEQALVCEQTSVPKATAHDILVQYVSTHADCFWIDRKSENKFVIKPNLQSDAIRQTNRGWTCKCAP